MKFGGVDLSLSATGVCVVRVLDTEEGPKPIATSTTVATTPDNGDPYSHLRRIDEISTQVVEFMRGADLVALEDFAFGAPMRAHLVGGLAYHARMRLWKAEIPFFTVAPTTLKKYATGAGKSKKNSVMMHVFKKWGFTCSNDNEADAFVLARIAYDIALQSRELAAYELECLHSVTKRNPLLQEWVDRLRSRTLA